MHVSVTIESRIPLRERKKTWKNNQKWEEQEMLGEQNR